MVSLQNGQGEKSRKQVRIKDQNINKILIGLLVVSAVVRGLLAAWMEFGNDEVYYWTYALYPDWSHFDHPPMVGWVSTLSLSSRGSLVPLHFLP